MRLKPGCASEYHRRHEAIWPELQQALHAAGISDYSIFLDPSTGHLFAVQKLTDDHTAANLPQLAIMQTWWQHMRELMLTHPDGSPICTPLTEVFHLA